MLTTNDQEFCKLIIWDPSPDPGPGPYCLSSTVQLWVVGNYHWYLKQSLDFGADPQRTPVRVCWDPERPLRFHVVTHAWTTVTYDWGWTTERSPGLDATDGAGVAVIDGGGR